MLNYKPILSDTMTTKEIVDACCVELKTIMPIMINNLSKSTESGNTMFLKINDTNKLDFTINKNKIVLSYLKINKTCRVLSEVKYELYNRTLYYFCRNNRINDNKPIIIETRLSKTNCDKIKNIILDENTNSSFVCWLLLKGFKLYDR